MTIWYFPCPIASFSKQIGIEFAFTNRESYGLTHYVQLLHRCWTRPANDLALLIAGNMDHHLLCHWTTQPCHSFSLYTDRHLHSTHSERHRSGNNWYPPLLLSLKRSECMNGLLILVLPCTVAFLGHSKLSRCSSPQILLLHAFSVLDSFSVDPCSWNYELLKYSRPSLALTRREKVQHIRPKKSEQMWTSGSLMQLAAVWRVALLHVLNLYRA